MEIYKDLFCQTSSWNVLKVECVEFYQKECIEFYSFPKEIRYDYTDVL